MKLWLSIESVEKSETRMKSKAKNLIIYDVEEPTCVIVSPCTTMLTKLGLQKLNFNAVTKLGQMAEGRNLPFKVIGLLNTVELHFTVLCTNADSVTNKRS